MEEVRVFKRFIDQAEHVWLQIATSAIGKKVFTVNGVDYSPLPERYNTKRKISRIFRRYWGKSLAETMINNLHLRLLKGKLCVPYGPTPSLPTTVESIQMKVNGANQKVVSAVLTDGNRRTRVDYRMIRAGDSLNFTIMKRSGREYDLRYRPIALIPSRPKPKTNTKPKSKSNRKAKGRTKLLKTP